MREFFKGWRRKVGCLLLVMACVLMGMWIKGKFNREMMEFRFDDHSAVEISFTATVIECEYQWETSRIGAFRDLPFANWMTFPNKYCSIQSDAIFPAMTNTLWKMSLGNGSSANGKGIRLMIPYWFLVLPVTLLSAYLLVWKPRQRTGPEHA
ncbi:MAG: hypothetical protein JSS49_00030 [Planctomycetes bacterium]|nr:hypothetical protein [Planctomycetota bacterium]